MLKDQNTACSTMIPMKNPKYHNNNDNKLNKTDANKNITAKIATTNQNILTTVPTK